MLIGHDASAIASVLGWDHRRQVRMIERGVFVLSGTWRRMRTINLDGGNGSDRGCVGDGGTETCSQARRTAACVCGE